MIRPRVGPALALALVTLVTTSAEAQRPTGAPGAGGRPPGPPPADSALYVRTTPPTDPVIQRMWTEGTEGSQVMKLAQVLLDSIGPRLNNSDRFDAGQDWLVKTYGSWGIPAARVPYGTWVKWVRGPTYLDMVAPRMRTLEATALGWSPGTNGQWVEAEVVLLPRDSTAASWTRWATAARGKFVLYSAPNPSCRMASQWTEFGVPGARARTDSTRQAWAADYASRRLAGGNPKEWPVSVGVAGVLTNTWSNYPGIDKVFGTPKDRVPTLDVSCEDYNLLYRLAENNQGPKVRLYAESQNLGEQPVHNVIATIRGSELPNEYIVFSAHYDSWDGGSGATDNGTGTLTMLEAARILKKIYPNPRRTIIIGHWGGEEQGLNGSRAWVADNPNIVSRIHAGFNQDNGTGRIQSVSPGPAMAGQDAIVRYLKELPASMTGAIRVGGAGAPGTGGSDHSSFQCMKAPLYGVGGISWDYSSTTWHTNRDTFDKVVPEDLRHNAMLVAMLAYMADRDPALLPRDMIELKNPDGTPRAWPTCPTGDRDTKSSPR